MADSPGILMPTIKSPIVGLKLAITGKIEASLLHPSSAGKGAPLQNGTIC